MHSKHIFIAECLSGWVRKRRKNECLRCLVCNTGYDRGKTSGGVIALCMTHTMNRMTHCDWRKALTARNTCIHMHTAVYFTVITCAHTTKAIFLGSRIKQSIPKEHGVHLIPETIMSSKLFVWKNAGTAKSLHPVALNRHCISNVVKTNKNTLFLIAAHLSMCSNTTLHRLIMI